MKIGPWFAKARSNKRAGALPPEHDALVAPLFDGDWTDDSTPPVSLV
ncbi:hypothetical protein [Actinacidiphila oryziradicis]|nr:hypothetical protein [Actinacidiphila oryziradicis]